MFTGTITACLTSFIYFYIFIYTFIHPSIVITCLIYLVFKTNRHSSGMLTLNVICDNLKLA